MRRTRKPKGRDDKFKIPPYEIGSVIQHTSKKFVIVDYCYPILALNGVRNVHVIDLDTKQFIRSHFSYHDLAVFDYKIVGHMTEEEIERLRLPRKGKSKADANRCGEGKQWLLEECKIVAGKNPLKRGVVPQFKGSRVVGLKVRCPECGKIVGVKLHKRKQEFRAVKHKAQEQMRRTK